MDIKQANEVAAIICASSQQSLEETIRMLNGAFPMFVWYDAKGEDGTACIGVRGEWL